MNAGIYILIIFYLIVTAHLNYMFHKIENAETDYHTLTFVYFIHLLITVSIIVIMVIRAFKSTI